MKENSSSNDNEKDDDDWKSVDENQENPIAPLSIDEQIPVEEPQAFEQNQENEFSGWANFASFEPKPEESIESETPAIEQTNEDDDNNWAFFESKTEPEPIVSSPSPSQEKVDEEDDDFGEFTEVQVSSEPPPPPPQIQTPTTLPIENLSSEKIESLISACFPIDSSVSSSMSDHPSHFPELPSFTTLKTEEKSIDYLEPSLSLWKVLSNLSSDPVGITFQWRKSNTERLFHQALGVSERFRTKTVPLTPEVLQPEKVKTGASTTNDSETNASDAKISSPTVRPHFDWKQSGLENPLADNDSSSLSSNLSKNEEISTGKLMRTLIIFFHFFD